MVKIICSLEILNIKIVEIIIIYIISLLIKYIIYEVLILISL